MSLKILTWTGITGRFNGAAADKRAVSRRFLMLKLKKPEGTPPKAGINPMDIHRHRSCLPEAKVFRKRDGTGHSLFGSHRKLQRFLSYQQFSASTCTELITSKRSFHKITSLKMNLNSGSRRGNFTTAPARATSVQSKALILRVFSVTNISEPLIILTN